MCPCHAGGPPVRPKMLTTARACTDTARAATARGGRGRPGAVAGDRREGHGRASGSYPRGMAGRRRAMWPERRCAAARTEEGPERPAVAAAAWRRAATARNGGVEQRRRRRKFRQHLPTVMVSVARRCAGEEKRRAVYTAKTHRSRAVATPGTYDSLFPGVATARDL